MKLDCCFTTDVGNIRNNNEDNFYLNGHYKYDPEQCGYTKSDIVYKRGIFAVCDGMGGEEFGEKAALITVETLKEYQNEDFDVIANDYINKANEKICKLTEENNGARSGSTLALVYINDNKAVSYNVGDSRVYLFRNGSLTQISQEHTQGAQMVRMGVLTKEQELTHRSRHVLTQHLGISSDELIIQAYKSEKFEVLHNDIILLCSDGLTDMLDDEAIENILKENDSANEYVTLLKDMAIKKGGKDNLTIGIIKVVNKKSRLFNKLWRMF